MGLHIVLFVIGVAIVVFGIPVTALVTAFVVALVSEDDDAVPVGFIGGYVLGIIVAVLGALLTVFQGIAIAQLIWG